ncbi:hypothetical protein Ctaglu_12360 [Clostridium tagluense]|uniref:Uncharacterized protein n=1 Tax=Clostridium tagluense TaxID=360422 RepID=A0A401UJ71_9CLOT|nr:hypothetical protein Ctaglu_12360 [Clostridium tagluense]
MKKYYVNKDILWRGKVDDRNLPFHRFILTKGSTYNSYLLINKKLMIFMSFFLSDLLTF